MKQGRAQTRCVASLLPAPSSISLLSQKDCVIIGNLQRAVNTMANLAQETPEAVTSCTCSFGASHTES